MNSPANPQAKRLIGQILIDQGILTEDQLRIALLEQMKSHLPVGRLLVQLGFVSEATLRDALSEKLGMQSVDLGHIIVDPSALKLLPRLPQNELRAIAKGGARDQLVHAARKMVAG